MNFALAHASGGHWGKVAKECLEGIAGKAAHANMGFLYATEAFLPSLSSILTFLRGTTHIQHWVGGAAPGLFAGDEEFNGAGHSQGGALAVMVGWLPEDSFRVFSCLDGGSFGDGIGPWLEQHGPCLGLVHADPRNPALLELVAEASAGAMLVGGLMSAGGPPAQVADTVFGGALSGLLLGAGVPVVTGISQGCSPMGALHSVTEAWDGVVMGLDGRSALDVLREEVGELLARDLRRIAGYVHIGLPIEGADDESGDYTVRTLLGVDPKQGWLAVGGRIAVGDQLMFVRRDANSAQRDLRRMLADVAFRLAGRPARAAFYVSCVGRGAHMFGDEGGEMAIVRDALGEVPLIGFHANGEIRGDRLYGYTGVLAVLAGEVP
jgi:small ligand-binding sensory domain FIST